MRYIQKYEQSIDLRYISDETALALCLEAMQNLQWTMLSAGADNIVACTKDGGEYGNQRVTCRIDGNELSLCSEMMEIGVADMNGYNKKNVQEFIKAFNYAKTTTANSEIERNKIFIQTLAAQTLKAPEQLPGRGKVNNSFNLPIPGFSVTIAIIASNVIVFILMALNGAGVVDANGLVHIRWGSDYAPLTLSGDWWRLLSSIFIHFGVMHLAMNMLCFYYVGTYLEPVLGKARYLAAYLCTGVIANLVSLWWHSAGANSAGASGAIFGLYGLFLVLLITNVMPAKVKQSFLYTTIFFIGYNLIFNTKSGIDNAAHLGGVVSGIVFGYIYVYRIKKERDQEHKSKWTVPAITLLTTLSAFLYLHQHKIPASERSKALDEIESSGYFDYSKFMNNLAEFMKIDKEVNDIKSNSNLDDHVFLNKITEVAIPALNQAGELMRSMDNYEISSTSHTMAAKLLRYVNLRKQELQVIKQMIETKNKYTLAPQLTDIRQKADALFDEAMK